MYDRLQRKPHRQKSHRPRRKSAVSFSASYLSLPGEKALRNTAGISQAERRTDDTMNIPKPWVRSLLIAAIALVWSMVSGDPVGLTITIIGLLETVYGF
jgi:hypothetical protein